MCPVNESVAQKCSKGLNEAIQALNSDKDSEDDSVSNSKLCSKAVKENPISRNLALSTEFSKYYQTVHP